MIRTFQRFAGRLTKAMHSGNLSKFFTTVKKIRTKKTWVLVNKRYNKNYSNRKNFSRIVSFSMNKFTQLRKRVPNYSYLRVFSQFILSLKWTLMVLTLKMKIRMDFLKNLGSSWIDWKIRRFRKGSTASFWASCFTFGLALFSFALLSYHLSCKTSKSVQW
jgi:hypothetical protein